MNQILITLLVVFAGLHVQAADKSSGCGLGWKVNSKNSLSGITTRATTNPYGITSLFGTTSGTSGCARHSIVKVEKRGLHYAEANYNNLLLEMATGSGEFLDGFAVVLGCKPDAFGPAMQRNYSQIIQNGNAAQPLLNQVNLVIQNDSALSAHCSNASI